MKEISFKKWAFHFIIWILVLNVIIIYLTISLVDFPGLENNTISVLLYLGILANILLFLSIVFIVISSIRNEKKNYQYWVSITGIILFGILPFILSFVAYLI
ncbi:hypothetical protein SAMN04489722_102402 [Algibacter lectus]|uniref:hypothetical protein n=1 Tax=Algibacter lectus TaxID=221126 RepID=UPI0005A70FBC|nr:hypothetical protein [Algibacter lectus]SFC42632.1 hypothetical protein SAMN04489722_102402 [Algibacter lectus]